MTRAMLGSLAIAALCGSPTIAWAVCPDGPLSVEREYREAVAIVVARVESEHPTPNPPRGHDEGTTYRVKVTERVQGKAAGTVNLLSENNSGRFPMEVGETYLLFISKGPGALVVDNCGNSGVMTERRELLAQLKARKH